MSALIAIKTNEGLTKRHLGIGMGGNFSVKLMPIHFAMHSAN